ncbi:Septin-9 [Myotis brandtii]|uniref:Septin-9 n=1 Tax=Myotis brandtii TaxID=109478 RepID=S7NMV7_MYOBR|nr:Septin-9 [Myotis brandtii]
MAPSPPGQSGLGKSTLINTLFKSKISRKSVQPPSSEERIPKTIEIKSITHGERGAGPASLPPEAGCRVRSQALPWGPAAAPPSR